MLLITILITEDFIFNILSLDLRANFTALLGGRALTATGWIIIDTNVMNDYIIPCYEPLHSQSKHYIVEDLTEVLKESGALN